MGPVIHKNMITEANASTCVVLQSIENPQKKDPQKHITVYLGFFSFCYFSHC